MKKSYNKIIILAFAIFLMFTNGYNTSVDAATATPAKPQAAAYLSVSPIDVVNHPGKYLNKNITFTAEFVAFTSLGLDYKPAFRDGTKYIGILIKRPDVTDHVIPLSEMKIFISRELAEKNIDIEAGDKVKITGKVFSNALGEPWVDVTTFTMLTHKNKSAKK